MGLLINTVLLLTQGSIGSKTQIGQDDTALANFTNFTLFLLFPNISANRYTP